MAARSGESRGCCRTSRHGPARALGLSDGLIADLIAWRDAMNDFNWGSHQDWMADQKVLDQRAEALVERLRIELGSRFEVRYQP